MVAARRDVVNADSSETAGPDSAHPKTASDKTMGASKATKKTAKKTTRKTARRR